MYHSPQYSSVASFNTRGLYHLSIAPTYIKAARKIRIHESPSTEVRPHRDGLRRSPTMDYSSPADTLADGDYDSLSLIFASAPLVPSTHTIKATSNGGAWSASEEKAVLCLRQGANR